jgi:hypothetical protein
VSAAGRDAGPEPPALQPAIDDLARLRELLLRAGRGDAPVNDVLPGVQRFWSAHKEELALAATAVGEQVRQQLLDKLYRWREQLQQQHTREPGRS